MEKKIEGKGGRSLENDNLDREAKILNVICNTTILLMSLMTGALTSVFSKLSKEMITTLTSELGTPADTTNEMHDETNKIQNHLPKQIREELLAMKADVTAQYREKKEKIASLIADKRFDDGIAIVERYTFNIPKLSCDLDERSLIGYFALLQENNEEFSRMFQELLEWMKTLPLQKQEE